MRKTLVLFTVLCLFAVALPLTFQANSGGVELRTVHAQLWDEAAGLVGCGNAPQVILTDTHVCYVYGGPNGQCSFCDIMRLAQSILNFLIFAGVLIAALLFVNAGILYLGASANPGNVSRAHKIFVNTVIGLLVILAAWLLIDVAMKTLYGEDGKWGPWNQIICKGEITEPVCIEKREGIAQLPAGPGPGTGPGPGGGGGGGGGGGSGVQCAATNIACSVSSLQAIGFTPTQANIMSCIAMTESSGISGTPPYNVTHPGSNSSACGTFQITRTLWNENKVPGCESFGNCMVGSCNAKVALKVVQKNAYRDWVCPGCNAKAQACINKYSP